MRRRPLEPGKWAASGALVNFAPDVVRGGNQRGAEERLSLRTRPRLGETHYPPPYLEKESILGERSRSGGGRELAAVGNGEHGPCREGEQKQVMAPGGHDSTCEDGFLPGASHVHGPAPVTCAHVGRSDINSVEVLGQVPAGVS